MPCPLRSFYDSSHPLLQVAKGDRAKSRLGIGKMYISLSLLVLFIGSTSAKKQGDFGIFTACLTDDSVNASLRLDCYYAKCQDSPFQFDCEFLTPNGTLLAKESNEKCKYVLPGEHQQYANKAMNCTLTRKQRPEKIQITIDYGAQGKKRIKICSATTALLLHRAPTLVWPVVILCLWRVLSTDSQTT